MFMDAGTSPDDHDFTLSAQQRMTWASCHPLLRRTSIGLRCASLLRTGDALAVQRHKRLAPDIVRAEGLGAISDGFSSADGNTAQHVGIAGAIISARESVIARVIAAARVVGAGRHA